MDLGSAASLWLLATSPGTDVTPIDSAASSIVGYWLSFGAIAVVSAVLFWLYIWPGKLTQKARDEARADVLTQVRQQEARAERAEARAEKAEAKTEELESALRDRLVPLVASFTQATSALLPLLQSSLARYAGPRGDARDEPPR